MSTFTTNKGIEQPASGSYNNTWDVPVNADWSIIDKAFGGTTTLNATGASGTTTLTLSQYQPPNIVITGFLTANLVYSIPSGVGGVWTIYNNTSGAYTVTFSSGGGGTAITLQQGARTQVVSDGTNIQLANNNIGVVPIVNGGTGASTAATAAANLLPSQSGNSGKYLTTDGSALSWGTPSGGGGGGSGTVTSVNTGGIPINGLSITGGPITTSGTISLTGSLTNVSLSSQVAGTLPVANGGTGLTSTPGVGQIDIGNGSGFTRANITGGTGITVTNGAGSITISASGSGGTPGGSNTQVQYNSSGAFAGSSNLTFNGTTLTANTLAVTNDATVNGITFGRGASSVSTNTAAGVSTLRVNSSGTLNTGIGYYTLYSNTSGYSNTAAGNRAMYSITNGAENTVVGDTALYTDQGGSYNCAFGLSAMYNSLGSNSNSAFGYGSLSAITTGSENVGVGDGAGRQFTTGNYNTAVGAYASYACLTGSYNTAVGASALTGCNYGSGNIGIGGTNSSGAFLPARSIGAFDNNLISMGSTSVTAAYIQVAWTVVSDARDKTNFGSVPHGLDFVTKLNPVSYQFKFSRDNDTPNGAVRYGFKAQDILALEGDSPVIIDSRDPEKLYYNGESLVPVLVNAIKDLKTELDALKAEIAALKGA
jgi:hypothetical protein